MGLHLHGVGDAQALGAGNAAGADTHVVHGGHQGAGNLLLGVARRVADGEDIRQHVRRGQLGGAGQLIQPGRLVVALVVHHLEDALQGRRRE